MIHRLSLFVFIAFYRENSYCYPGYLRCQGTHSVTYTVKAAKLLK